MEKPTEVAPVTDDEHVHCPRSLPMLQFGMTPKEILENNGDFKTSPLLDTAHRIHDCFEASKIPYVFIGGMAVIRNNARRTTVDVDVISSHEGWVRLSKAGHEEFAFHPDWAEDRANGIEIDVVFPGDDWEMAIPYPQPEEVREWDPDLNGWYLSLRSLIEIKTAVYQKKLAEDGKEVAAKELADLVALTHNNRSKITTEFIATLNAAIREQYREIVLAVLK